MTLVTGCTEACGWLAAGTSVIGFGSFGVPIKSKAANKVDIHPLAMQTYKSFMCFLTCWLIIPMGEPFSFTPYGILSGLFWVPGATCGIYGIRNAGLAISVGIWSSVSVLTSFAWGVCVFGEGFKNLWYTCCACFVLVTGICGMAFYSSPVQSNNKKEITKRLLDEEDHDEEKVVSKDSVAKRKVSTKPTDEDDETASSPKTAPMEIEPLVENDDLKASLKSQSPAGKEGKDDPSSVVASFMGGRIRITRRGSGIIGAFINGAWGSNSLIPMHYAAKEGFGGPSYLISFASGSMIVTFGVWVLVLLYHAKSKGFSKGYEALPSLHLREMWVSGFLSGGLYSFGNFGSILSVIFLGQAVGYTVCQSQMLVSGLWGIFFYKEIRGWDHITKWFCSAVITVAGILWLGYQHEGSTVVHR